MHAQTQTSPAQLLDVGGRGHAVLPGERTGASSLSTSEHQCDNRGRETGRPLHRSQPAPPVRIVHQLVSYRPSATRSLDPSIPRSLSALRNWPIQLTLIPPSAPYLKNADLLISADCVGSSHPNFHEDLVKGRVLIIACPKLDDAEACVDKLTQMFTESTPKSVTCAHMTVPCCFGLVHMVKQAIADSGKTIPFAEVTIDVDGKKVK